MESAPRHVTTPELEQALDNILTSPKEAGPLRAIFLRPQTDERRAVAEATLSRAGGIDGDRWAVDHWQQLPDGRSDPQSQVSLMNARILKLVAGGEDAMCLAGDNLIVDLDLSEANLPAGTRLQIGAEVVLEFTSVPHTGCGKFNRRYGQEALKFINGPVGATHSLRGRFARIVEGGKIAVGDRASKG